MLLLFLFFFQNKPNMILVTIDTARADAFGVYGGPAKTPNFDALANKGVQFQRALATSPLTLPSHASILTGLNPPEHGLRSNGVGVLDKNIPTIATVLKADGYQTAAFVSSRVLDRRFGLSRGFDVYNDSMAEDHKGEFGYPERVAEETMHDVAAWLKNVKGPFFLWVHFYDPHAPYNGTTQEEKANYYQEIEGVDLQLGKLLGLIDLSRAKVVVTADHGEGLGEHGEDRHGLFLFNSTLHVPLIVWGEGVPSEKKNTVVSLTQIPAFFLADLAPTEMPVGLLSGVLDEAYFEATLAFDAYGWSPLYGIHTKDQKVIGGPGLKYKVSKPWLGDEVFSDLKNRELANTYLKVKKRFPDFSATERTPEMEELMASLGYASSGTANVSMADPHEKIEDLKAFLDAKRDRANGELTKAKSILEKLVLKNPNNLPFLQQLAHTNLDLDEPISITQFELCVALNPNRHFSHLNLAKAYHKFNRLIEAEKSFWQTVALNDRSAEAWLALAELAFQRGQPEEEWRLLQAALDSGVQSSALHLAVASRYFTKKNPRMAQAHLKQALEIQPKDWLAWYLLGKVQWSGGFLKPALDCMLRAYEYQPDHRPLIHDIAQLYGAMGLEKQKEDWEQRARGLN